MFESCRDRQRGHCALRNEFNNFLIIRNLFVAENSRCITDSVCSAGSVQLQGGTHCPVCSMQHGPTRLFVVRPKAVDCDLAERHES
jgi:hypothetical protein